MYITYFWRIYHAFLFFSGYHICERKSDVESPGEEECKLLLPTTDLNKMPLGTNKEGTTKAQMVHYLRIEIRDSQKQILSSLYHFFNQIIRIKTI